MLGENEKTLELSDAIIAISHCHPEIEEFFLKLLFLMAESNVYPIYRSEIYNLIKELSYIPRLRKDSKAETAIKSLEEINFLLPDSVRENLEKYKELEKRDVETRKKDLKKAFEELITTPTKFDQ